MSIIQRIRDKGALISAIVIALALLGFILMDAFSGRAGFGSSQGTTVGRINGHKVEYASFNQKVQYFQEQRGGGEASAEAAVSEAWKGTVDSVLLSEQFDQLGITVTDREMNDLLFGSNPPQDLAERFVDSVTGRYNPREAQMFIQQIRSKGRIEDREMLNNYLVSHHNARRVEKFTAVFTHSVYYPDWYLEKRNALNSIVSDISYISIPYSSIPDDSVKVTDAEIEKYIRDNRSQFEQKEESRSINYVLFSARPSPEDSAAAIQKVNEIRPEFDTLTDHAAFIARNSVIQLYDGYVSGNSINNPNKELILSGPVGRSIDPYLDPGLQGQPSNFVSSKIIDVKQIPDTVKVRHILISLYQQDPNTGQRFQIRDDAEARRMIDSIQGMLRAGESFDSLVVKFSEDPGSKNTGGVYENVVSGQMVPTFNDFIFTNRPGSIDVVKTDYGYHLVEILSQKGSSTGYRIAYLAKPVITSQSTESEAQNRANMFAGDSRSLKAFNDNWEKNLRPAGIQKMTATDIRPMSYSIPGINGTNRSFIRMIFEADRDEVVGPQKVGDDYVVAVVTEVHKAGLQNAAAARDIVEPVLRNRKKAELIAARVGNITTLEEVAARMGQEIMPVENVGFAGGSMISYENKIVGAAANRANEGKVITQPIPGQNGVYIIRVDRISITPVENASLEEQRIQMESQVRQMFSTQIQYGSHPLLEPLRQTAKIRDYRADFF